MSSGTLEEGVEWAQEEVQQEIKIIFFFIF